MTWQQFILDVSVKSFVVMTLGLAMARPKDLPRRIGCLLDTTRSHLAMSRSRAMMLLVAMMLTSGVISVLRPVSMAADGAAEDKLSKTSDSIVRGTDETLQIRFHGTVMDEDGEPVLNPKLTLTILCTDLTEMEFTNPETHANSFEFWLPIGGLNWFGLDLEARRSDDSDELDH